MPPGVPAGTIMRDDGESKGQFAGLPEQENKAAVAAIDIDGTDIAQATDPTTIRQNPLELDRNTETDNTTMKNATGKEHRQTDENDCSQCRLACNTENDAGRNSRPQQTEHTKRRIETAWAKTAHNRRQT